MSQQACLALLLLATTTTRPLMAASPQLDVTQAPPAPEWKPIDPVIQSGPLTCLTKRTDAVVHGRLVYLDLYPGLCQNAMDQYADVLTKRCSGQRDVDASTCKGEVATAKASGWRPLEVVGIAAIAIAAGFVAGKVIH